MSTSILFMNNILSNERTIVKMDKMTQKERQTSKQTHTERERENVCEGGIKVIIKRLHKTNKHWE